MVEGLGDRGAYADEKEAVRAESTDRQFVARRLGPEGMSGPDSFTSPTSYIALRTQDVVGSPICLRIPAPRLVSDLFE